MVENTSDYLTAYRTFFEDFNANVNLNDPIPVTLTVHCVEQYEITGEVLDWCYRYLDARNCPPALLVPLSRATLEEVLVACRTHPQRVGYNNENGNFSALELSRATITKLITICQKYSDNAALSSLPPPGSEATSFVASFAGDRNGRRPMEDLHTSIHDIHKLYNLNDDLGEAGFYAIYDGHQGVRASLYCVSHLHEHLVTSPNYPTDPVAAFEDAFLTTDKNFLKKRTKGGCTAVCLLHQRKENIAYVAWAGDSLAVLSRSGIAIPLVQPHRPQVPSERQRIEDAGGTVIWYQGAFRVNCALAVSRAIGDADFKTFVTAKPQVERIVITPRDHFIILGSDGLWDFVSYETCVSIVYDHFLEGGDWRSASRALVKKAVVNGSGDNISALVVLLRSADDIAMDVMAEGAPIWVRPEDLGPETVVDDDLQLRGESHEVAEASESDEEWNFVRGSDNKENLPPRSAETADEAAVPESGNNAEEDLLEDSSKVVEEDDDMESGLNPDAAEFVPFGVISEPVKDFKSSDLPQAAVEPSADMDDVIIASSQGLERSLDDIEVPSEEEFDADIALRPADLDLDTAEISGKENEIEEEDSNPFVANNDVNDVLSSPTTPPAGVVEFATGEQAPLAFQTSDTSGQPPLNFQPFDNSQPLVSMSAEISSHFNFIDSHLAPEDDQAIQEHDEFDIDRLVMSKNHFIQEAEENKIEEDARESETLGKAEADTRADIMITSFHEDLSGTFGDEPPLSQKELLVGDEKHFMDKEDNARTTLSDLDSSFEVVQSKPEESADDAAASEDEVIDHAAHNTGLTEQFSNLNLNSPLDEESAKEIQEEVEQPQSDLIEADIEHPLEVVSQTQAVSEEVSHELIETRTDELHFTNNFFTQSFPDQTESEQVESPICNNLHEDNLQIESSVCNNLQEDSEGVDNLVNVSETTAENPFHEEPAFDHVQSISQNPFETQESPFLEEKIEEVNTAPALDSYQDIFDDHVKSTEDHFGSHFENAIVQEEKRLDEEESKPITELDQVNDVTHFTEHEPRYENPSVEEPAIEETPVESSPAVVEDKPIETEVVQEHVASVENDVIATEPAVQEPEPVPAVELVSTFEPEPIVEAEPVVEPVASTLVDEVSVTQNEPAPVEDEVVKAIEPQEVQAEAPVPEIEAPKVETPTEVPVCNGTSGHEEEVEVAPVQPAEPVVEASPVIPAAVAAVGVGAVAAATVGAVKAATAKRNVDAKSSAASKTAAKPLAAKTTAAKPAATAAAKKPTSAPATKTAAKPSTPLSAAAKSKAAAPAKPAVAAKSAPAAKPAAAKPTIGAASKPASTTAAKAGAPKPATAGARPTSAAAKPAAAARPSAAAARPASAAAKPAAAKPAAPAAKTTAAKPALTARPAAAKPATTAARPASATAKPAGTASSLAPKKPAAPAAKPLAAKAPLTKPTAAKPASAASKTAPVKKPANSSTGPVKKPSGSITAKKVESRKKVVNGGPHIDDLPGTVSSSSNGHIEPSPIATH